VPRPLPWLLLIAIAGCTVGGNEPATTPAPVAPVADQMPADALDKSDPGRDLVRPKAGSWFGWGSRGGHGTNVCGSGCNPCQDATGTSSSGPLGWLDGLWCSAGRRGGDPLLVMAAIALATRRRRPRPESRRRSRPPRP